MTSGLAKLRQRIEQPGQYLCYEENGELRTVALTREWTRIGRSLAADVRFDDPTVSRRHALIVRQPDGVRVLDDRSLNGVFVNGARVEGKVLKDGDEIIVGRYRLIFLDVAPTRPAREPRHGPRSTSADARRLPGPSAAATPPRGARVVSRTDGPHDRGALAEGRHRQDDRRAHPHRRVAPQRGATLAVDLDPQGNLSDYFDLPTDVEPTIADVLVRRAARRRGGPRAR